MNQQSELRHIRVGFLYNLVGFGTKILPPIFVLVLARLFPQDQFGLYLSIQLLILSISRVTVLGLDAGMKWYIPRPDVDAKVWRESSTITFMVGLGVTLFLLLLLFGGWADQIDSLKDVPTSFAVICVLALPFLTWQNYFAGALEGWRLPQYKIFVNYFIVTSLTPLLGMLFFYTGGGFNSLAWGYFIANFIGGILLFGIVAKKQKMIPWRFKKVPRDLFSYSWPLGISGFVVALIQRMDLWMILAMLGPEEAAVYGIMMTLSNGVKTIRQSFDSILVPAIASIPVLERATKIKPIFSEVVMMVCSLQMIVALAVLFFPYETLSIAGKDYMIQPKALGVLLVGNLLNGFIGMNGQILAGIGKSRRILGINVFVLGLNITLNFYMIPAFGLAGAAGATAISYLVQNLYYLVAQYRITRVFPYESKLIFFLIFIASYCCVLSFSFESIVSLSLISRGLWFLLFTCVGVAIFVWNWRSKKCRNC